MGAQFPEMLSVQGGPWTFTRCELKATDVCVTRCRGRAILLLEDTAIGGHGKGMLDDERTTARATEGVAAEGHSTVHLRDCTLQFCGAWSSAACRASHLANVTAERCFFFQNSFCGVAVHGSCTVSLSQCSFLEQDTAALVAVLARNASLELSNVTVDGRWWADARRPGRMSENSSTLAPRTRKRRLPADEKLQGLFDFVGDSAEKIVSEWEALCDQGTGSYEPVLAHLEALVQAMGGTTEQMQTGRQRLQLPRHVAVTNPFRDPDDSGEHENATADRLFAEWLAQANDTDPEFETLPPLLLASFAQRAAAGAPTLCVYVRMEPAALSALGDPGLIAEAGAQLIEDASVQLSRRRYGQDALRALSFLAALQAFEAAGAAPPVHLKLLVDFLEEAHASVLHKRLRSMRAPGGFLDNVDGAVLLLGEWLSALQPALVRGFRGLASCQLVVECADEDLHSGLCGGAVREAFPELMHLLASLQDVQGNILVPAIAKWATPISEEERQELRQITFPTPDWACIDADAGRVWSQEDALCKVWHRPSLSIHGVEGAWAEAGMRSVIPGAPTAKLSVRLAPGMEPTDVLLALQHHLEGRFAAFKSPNRMTLKFHTAWRAWRAPCQGWLRDAAVRATERVHGATPEMICQGSSTPIPGMFEEALGGREVLVLPLWHREEELEADEQLRQTQAYLIESVKIAAALMDEAGSRKGV